MERDRIGLLAGAARLEITPEPGVELMGYGARNGVSTGVHDALHARSLALRTRGGGLPGLVIVVADLCLLTPAQAGSVRRAIGAGTGLPPEAILVSCTHTHSGPDTGLTAQMTRRPEPSHVRPLMERLAEVGCRAFEEAEEASLVWRRAEAHIGRNRRLADGPLDPEVLVLHVRRSDGTPLAVLYSHGCHGTVLGHDNLEISADWAGVASREIEAVTGGTALFLLGAHADIDPRTRGLMDLAIEGQSVGLGFDAVEVLGREVAEAVLGSISSDDDAEGQAVRIGFATRTLRLPVHLGNLPEEDARKEIEARKATLSTWLGVSTEEFPRLSELDDRVRERSRRLPPSEAREWISRARLYLRDRTARHWIEGAAEVEVEAQLLRIGPAALLALPLEPTTAVGLDWKRRTRGTAPFSTIAGIGNGWLRYLPHPDDLADPLANQRYEILSSLLEPGACEELLGAGEALLRDRFS